MKWDRIGRKAARQTMHTVYNGKMDVKEKPKEMVLPGRNGLPLRRGRRYLP